MNRSLSCRALRVVSFAWLLGLATPAMAQEYIVRNDSMDNSFSGRIATAGLVAGEAYTATFVIPDHLLPAELLGVQVIMVNDSKPGVTNYCGRFSIEVWEESTIQPTQSPTCPSFVNFRQKEPGDVIYSMSAQFANDPLGFMLRGDPNNLQELRFSTINSDPSLNVFINPVMLPVRRVRVGIKAIDNFCVPTAGQAYPVIVTDQTESSDNFLYGYYEGICPAPNYHYLWRDFQSLFSAPTGDFVMRLILRDPNSGGGGQPDAGMGEPDVGMGEPDVGMGEPDVGGHDDLDAGNDLDDVAVDHDSGDNLEPDVGHSPDVSTPDTGGEATLAITSISPSSAANTSSTNVVILGRGFAPGAQVLLGADNIGVTETLSERIRATIPEGLNPGVYDVIVTNPGGQSALLSQAFTVTVAGDDQPNDDPTPVPPSGDGIDGVEDGCGCRIVAAPTTGPGSILGLLLGLMALVRLSRRRT
jgi:hypothetical protein